MESKSSIKVETRVRKHLRRSTIQRIRQWWVCRRLGYVGRDVFVEENVKFQRFPANIRIGSNVILKEGARMCAAQPNAYIRIGDWTTIGYHTFLFASSGIKIGSSCLIAPFCYIVDTNHSIRKDEPIRSQMMTASEVTIGNDVWLGAGVRVLRGVTIHNGVVVGAGSVVTDDVSPYRIVMGVPAKTVGERE